MRFIVWRLLTSMVVPIAINGVYSRKKRDMVPIAHGEDA